MSQEPSDQPDFNLFNPDAAGTTPWQRWFPITLAGAFFVFVLIQVAHHVMWRDEIRTWQVCRECKGLISLWDAMRYEGVPVLWYWVVFLLTRIGDNPILMQIAHASIATGVIFVIARWAPFPRQTKVLLSLGYFPLYEYGVITRNYSLVFLFLMIACAMISRPRIRFILLTIVLFLLTQVSIWGAGFAGLMLAVAVAKGLWSSREVRPGIWAIVIAAVIVLTGIVSCYIEVLPGPGPSFTGTWFQASAFDRALGTPSAMYRACFPIPAFSAQFWNTNILDPHVAPNGRPITSISNPWLALQAILGAVCIICAILAMLRRPLALALLVCGGAALLIFEYRFHGFARHHGQLFMVLIAACWFADTTSAWTSSSSRFNSLLAWLDRARRPALMVVALAGACAGIGASLAMNLPFSASGATAEYIHQNISDKTILVAVDDYCGSPISQWLNRPIYSPQMHAFVRYNTQDDHARFPVEVNSLVGQIVELALNKDTDVLLILSSGRMFVDHDSEVQFQLPNGAPPVRLLIKVLPTFQNSVVADEFQSLYLFSVIKRAAAPAGDFHL